jgi:hypothetical protein
MRGTPSDLIRGEAGRRTTVVLFVEGDLPAPRAGCFRPLPRLSLPSAGPRTVPAEIDLKPSSRGGGEQAARGGPLHRPREADNHPLPGEAPCLSRLSSGATALPHMPASASPIARRSSSGGQKCHARDIGGPSMRSDSSTGLRVAAHQTCVVYDKKTGKVAHIHDCITFEGAELPSKEHVEARAMQLTRQFAAKDQARSAEGAACRAGGAGEGGGADGRREGAEARRGIFTAGGGRQGKDQRAAPKRPKAKRAPRPASKRGRA